ncbi:MAG TPA: hypothetical protein VFJ19_00330 [Nocardioidaceae bacterium]|nr:hypothetical protein [Nocardioidaceae bacterium]
MSVTDRCGLQDPGGAQMYAARAAWMRWSTERPELRVVEDLADIHEWTRSVSSREANNALGVLASMTDSDPDAITALMWALLPGAESLARRLADLSEDIDGLVAGQLWIEAAGAHRLEGRVSSTILRRVRSEVCSEAGIGEAAARRDRAWSLTLHDVDLQKIAQSESTPEPDPELVDLFHAAEEQGAITGLDYWLLWALAAEADRQNAPAHRGRFGLTAPSVVEAVADEAGLAPRSLRTRAARALDRLTAYADARDDPLRFAEWKAQHRPCELTLRDEMDLVLIGEEWDRFVSERPGVPFKQVRVAFNVVLGTRCRRTA